jgi:hypothetical protein
MGIFSVLDILLQVAAACASIGRVYTPHRVIGRRWNAAALLCIALDYSLHYIIQQKGIYFTGALVFWTLSLRTAIILIFKLEGDDYGRKLLRVLIAGTAWLACAVIVTLNQYLNGGFDPKTLAVVDKLSTASIDLKDLGYLAGHIVDPTVIALAGLGLGCLGEAMGDMIRTRRCVFGMGILMAGFAVTTQNWGQLFKNVMSDIAATVASAIEFQDPPFQRWFPNVIAKMSAAVRSFRSRHLVIRPASRARVDAP